MVGGAIWGGVGSVTSKSPYKSSTRNVETVDNAYDVDVAIGRFVDGTATDADFKLFAPENTANRQALYEATGIKLPIDSRLTNYSLLALNSKNRNIRNLYLNHAMPRLENTTLKPDINADTKNFYLKHDNHLKQPDSLTDNGESGIMNMDNKSVREWYVNNVSNILNQIDKTGTLKEQAVQAFNLRNIYKREARLLMTDRKTAELLEKKRPVLTFDELLKSKMIRKHMTEEEALWDILNTASKTNADVNKEFGLGGD